MWGNGVAKMSLAYIGLLLARFTDWGFYTLSFFFKLFLLVDDYVLLLPLVNELITIGVTWPPFHYVSFRHFVG
jgi:hypothetical protein